MSAGNPGVFRQALTMFPWFQLGRGRATIWMNGRPSPVVGGFGNGGGAGGGAAGGAGGAGGGTAAGRGAPDPACGSSAAVALVMRPTAPSIAATIQLTILALRFMIPLLV